MPRCSRALRVIWFDVSELEGDPTPVGPFTVYISRITRADWGTYALPTGTLEGAWRDDLARVVDVFRSEGRRGRVEWVDELYPELQAEVVGYGFTKVDVEPLLVLDDRSRLNDPAEIDVRRVGPGEPMLGQILENVRIAFDETEETTDQAVAERHEMLKADNKVMLMAVADGEPVGSGTVTHVRGVAEITAIATRTSHRGRGVASAITSKLARVALDAGCDLVYLTARDDDAARIYRRLGFRRAGTYIEAAKPKGV
ncbi:MAG: GNAT family N-acetyltransferase [Actinomycetota bacterium]